MEHDGPADATDRNDRPSTGGRRRRFRLVPAAITPLEASDLAAGIGNHLRGRGRDAFRSTITEYLDGANAATYTSYRQALGACFRELAANGPDGATEVLLPAFCSYDFPHAIDGVGLTAERYDVDAGTLALDMDSVRKSISEDALALVVVNALGYGSAMDEIAAFCRRRGIYLVETLGYALGTTYEGDRFGTFGDCAVLNFQQGKPIPVGGGMVVSQDESLEFADESRSTVAPNVGALSGYALLSSPTLYGAYTKLAERFDGVADRATTHPGSTDGDAYAPPHATMSNFQGAIANRVFDRLESHRRHRASTARYYAAQLGTCPGVQSIRALPEISDHQFVRYPIVVPDDELRGELRAELRSAGIQATSLYDWPAIDGDQYPAAAWLQDGIVTLPTHPYVTGRDRRTVVETIRRVTEDANAIDAGEPGEGITRLPRKQE